MQRSGCYQSSWNSAPLANTNVGPRTMLAPARVLIPVRSMVETSVVPAAEAALLEPLVQPNAPPVAPAMLLAEITLPVVKDMEQMNQNLRNVVGNKHPMLMAAADQIFGAGGKKLRPMLVLLVARATAELAAMR